MHVTVHHQVRLQSEYVTQALQIKIYDDEDRKCWLSNSCTALKSCSSKKVSEEAKSSHCYSLLFFQGTADVLAGLEAIRIHSGCE